MVLDRLHGDREFRGHLPVRASGGEQGADALLLDRQLRGGGAIGGRDLSPPQFRGGAVIFGPVVRDHGYDLPKKVRRLGLRTALSSKQADGHLIVVDDAKLPEARTKALEERLAKLGSSSVLFIGGRVVDDNLKRAARNLPYVDVLPVQGANVYDILRRETLVITKDAVAELEARLK